MVWLSPWKIYKILFHNRKQLIKLKIWNCEKFAILGFILGCASGNNKVTELLRQVIRVTWLLHLSQERKRQQFIYEASVIKQTNRRRNKHKQYDSSNNKILDNYLYSFLRYILFQDHAINSSWLLRKWN